MICKIQVVTLGEDGREETFGHEAQLLKGQVAFVLIQPLEISPGPRAAFGRRRPKAQSVPRRRQQTISLRRLQMREWNGSLRGKRFSLSRDVLWQESTASTGIGGTWSRCRTSVCAASFLRG